jgi:hypothetical protein
MLSAPAHPSLPFPVVVVDSDPCAFARNDVLYYAGVNSVARMLVEKRLHWLSIVVYIYIYVCVCDCSVLPVQMGLKKSSQKKKN